MKRHAREKARAQKTRKKAHAKINAQKSARKNARANRHAQHDALDIRAQIRAQGIHAQCDTIKELLCELRARAARNNDDDDDAHARMRVRATMCVLEMLHSRLVAFSRIVSHALMRSSNNQRQKIWYASRFVRVILAQGPC